MSFKQIFCVFILVSLFLAGPGLAKDKQWVITVLEGPSGTKWIGSFGNDVSDSGYVVGGWFDADEKMHAAYWYKGDFVDLATDIGLPKGTDQSLVTSVNSNGLMGGAAVVKDSTDQRACLWDAGKETVTCLHPSDSYSSSTVYTVNASGDAVGWVTTKDGLNMAWVWPKGDSTGEALPGGTDYDGTQAFGLNSNGTIVGVGQTDTESLIPGWEVFPCNPVMWVKKGKTYELVDLRDDFAEGYPLIRAYDVSEDGEVIGRMWDDSLYTAAWSWTEKGGAVHLDDNKTGDASAWRASGKHIAGGIGYGPLGSMDGSWITDDAALWTNGDLEVIATEVTWDKVDYPYVEAASANKSGLVTGFCFTLELGAPYLPVGWIAEKK